MKVLDHWSLPLAAAKMADPHIIADVREGSGLAKFILVDAGDTLWMPEGSPQITRDLFNELRSGETPLLDGGGDPALKLDIYRAWKVRIDRNGADVQGVRTS